MLPRALVIAILVAVNVSSVSAEAPWHGDAFSGAPDEIVAAAAKIPFDEDVDSDTLFQRTRYAIEADGKCRTCTYIVWRVETREAARSEATISASWSPWFQKRPQIRARIIQPDGESFELDQSTIAELPVSQYDPQVLSDAKLLQAPLPRMMAGCVVEQEIVTEETQTFSSFGVLKKQALFINHEAQVEIEAPLNLPLRHRVIGFNCEPKVTKTDSSLTVFYNIKESWDANTLLPDLPRNESNFPFFILSTGNSWGDVATGYAELIEPRLDVEGMRPTVKKILTGTESANEATEKLLAWIRERVRYTGVEFGASAIIPNSPNITLDRSYGDCKDQSLLLVSMLRAAGFKANLALLNAGSREHIQSELPGLNAFDHAIVHVDGANPLWVDPTSPYLIPGQLPHGCDDRFALVVSPDTKDLTRTFRSSSADNKTIDRHIIKLTYSGKHEHARERIYTGQVAGGMRSFHALSKKSDVKDLWTQDAKGFHEKAELVGFEHSDPNAFDHEFRIRLSYESSCNAQIFDDQAQCYVDPSVVLASLPNYLLFAEDTKPDVSYALKPRDRSLQIPQRHQRTVTFELSPPDGFVPAKLPTDFRWEYGPLSIQQRCKSTGNNKIVYGVKLDTGDGLLSAEEVSRLRHDLSKLASDKEKWFVEFRWDSQAYWHLNRGEYAKAIKVYNELVERNPSVVECQVQRTQALVQTGLGATARKYATKTVDDFPNSALAWSSLADVLCRDSVGRLLLGDFDLAGAKAAYEKSLELDPNLAFARYNHAMLLERDELGYRYAGDMPKAIAEYEQVVDDPNLGPLAKNNIATIKLFQDDLKSIDLEPLKNNAPRIYLAVVALKEGLPSAFAKAEQLGITVGQGRETLVQAAGILEAFRHYETSAAMYEELVKRFRMSHLKPFVEADRKLRRTSNKVDATSPIPFVRGVARQAIMNGVGEEVLSPYVKKYIPDSTEFAVGLERPFQNVRDTIRSFGAPRERVGDAAVIWKFMKMGHENFGFFVRNLPNPILDYPFLVLPKDPLTGEHKLLMTGHNGSEIGRHALELLDGPDGPKVRQARQWLVWALTYQGKTKFKGAYTDSPFRHIWGYTKTDVEPLRVAAACLAANGKDVEGLLDILEPAVKSETIQSRRVQIDRALIIVYRKLGETEKAIALLAKHLGENPKEAWLHEYRINVLFEGKQTLEAWRAAKEFRKQFPRDHNSLIYLAEATGFLEDYAAAFSMLMEGIEQSKQAREDPDCIEALCRMALHLDRKKLRTRCIELARNTSEKLHHRSPRITRIYAALLAADGQVKESLRLLTDTVTHQPSGKMVDEDWYVVGRNLEQLGMLEDARLAYERVENQQKIWSSTYKLAQERQIRLNPVTPNQ